MHAKVSQQRDAESSLNGLNGRFPWGTDGSMGSSRVRRRGGRLPASLQATPSPSNLARGFKRPPPPRDGARSEPQEWEGGARLLMGKVGKGRKEYPILF